MQAIMFSTAARGSHIYRPAQASQVTATTINDDTGSETLITPDSVVAGTSETAGIVESASLMDVDHAALPLPPVPPPVSTNSGKRSHSIMSFESDGPQCSQSDSTPITAPSQASAMLNVVPKKQQKGSGISRDSQGSRSRDSQGNQRAQSFRAAKVTPAVAMVAMQSQIGRLTDVFERSMATPEDGTSSQRSLALSRLQERDDGLSMGEKVRLISIFQKDASYVQTYLDLVIDEVRQAWLRSILDSD